MKCIQCGKDIEPSFDSSIIFNLDGDFVVLFCQMKVFFKIS